jgi:glucose-6-phosphate 1-epimerase
LPNGDSVFVAQQGAHVLSWQAQGKERLFLSPVSVCDGVTAIRGGVPVCFPQFNQRGNLPKHGFARNMPWRLVQERSQGPQKVFELSSNDATLALWPHAFKTFLTVNLAPSSLQMTLTVENHGQQSLSFTGALHTYFAVDAISQVSLQGQTEQPEWDAVKDTYQKCSGQLRFDAEFDRVYDVQSETQPHWTLQDGSAHCKFRKVPLGVKVWFGIPAPTNARNSKTCLLQVTSACCALKRRASHLLFRCRPTNLGWAGNF